MKTQVMTKTALVVALTIGMGVAVSGAAQTANAAGGGGEKQVMAVPFNNPSAFKQAGFPATALNVNRTADGKLSWMATKSEMQRKSSFDATYLQKAQNSVAASLTESAVTSSQLFGIADTSTDMVVPLEFTGQTQATLHTQGGYYLICPNGEPLDEYYAPVHLPSGAIVTGMTAYGSDTSAADDADYYLSRQCPGGVYNGTGTAPEVHVTGGFVGGNYTVNSAASNLTIDNTDCVYYITADFSEGTCDGANYTLGVALRWKRQISPAPVTATFLDVPVGSTFHREVEALVSAGITSGCGGGNFCVNSNVTRGQMAAFLARSLGLHWDAN